MEREGRWRRWRRWTGEKGRGVNGGQVERGGEWWRGKRIERTEVMGRVKRS